MSDLRQYHRIVELEAQVASLQRDLRKSARKAATAELDAVESKAQAGRLHRDLKRAKSATAELQRDLKRAKSATAKATYKWRLAAKQHELPTDKARKLVTASKARGHEGSVRQECARIGEAVGLKGSSVVQLWYAKT